MKRGHQVTDDPMLLLAHPTVRFEEYAAWVWHSPSNNSAVAATPTTNSAFAFLSFAGGKSDSMRTAPIRSDGAEDHEGVRDAELSPRGLVRYVLHSGIADML